MGILNTTFTPGTQFGLREVCDVKFHKVSGVGPINDFTIETAKMTTLETAATTVYAQGGQGNSRRMAWDGEKTVTFTIEDALITQDTFHALTGATPSNGNRGGTKYIIKPTSFAGIYTITAYTLMRDDTGLDHLVEIIIPKAKLQTTLNLSMGATGDPSTFTFTFDALAGKRTEDTEDYLFSLEIGDEYIEGEVTSTTRTTYVTIEGETKQIETTDTTTNKYTLTIGAATGEIDPVSSITFGTTTFTTTLPDGKYLTNGIIMIGAGDIIDIKVGTSTHWEII